jgi:hypothetical protein
LNLFDKSIVTNLDKLYFYSEYLADTSVPVINNDLIFFGITNHLKDVINGVRLFNLTTYIALYISIAISLTWYSIKINKDVKCGVINNNIIDIYDKDNILYYDNMFNLICFFCNESKYIYEKIMYDAFDDKSIASNIVNGHIANLEEFNKIRNSINFNFDMSYFLKKNNLNKPWILTSNPY